MNIASCVRMSMAFVNTIIYLTLFQRAFYDLLSVICCCCGFLRCLRSGHHRSGGEDDSSGDMATTAGLPSAGITLTNMNANGITIAGQSSSSEEKEEEGGEAGSRGGGNGHDDDKADPESGGTGNSPHQDSSGRCRQD